MSEKAKDKGYHINVLIDPAFVSHIARKAMTYEELNARFSARGHSLAVLDHYYRPDAE
ncbi:hypothetical protein GGF32_006221 [Allomyces javanicus]|nr:hypothetical protein GGF32_006221 [Allomyces javanicus]